jgi:hypothetical protein
MNPALIRRSQRNSLGAGYRHTVAGLDTCVPIGRFEGLESFQTGALMM